MLFEPNPRPVGVPPFRAATYAEAMARPKAAERSAPGAVENLCPPKRPRPPAEAAPSPAAGGGVNEPEPRPRPAEAARKRSTLVMPNLGGHRATVDLSPIENRPARLLISSDRPTMHAWKLLKALILTIYSEKPTLDRLLHSDESQDLSSAINLD